MTKMHGSMSIFSGHSDLLAALLGYDAKSPLFGAPRSREVVPCDDSVKDDAGIFGGFVEVLVPPIVPPAIYRCSKGVRVEHPEALDQRHALACVMSDIGLLVRGAARLPGKVSICRTVADIQSCRSSGALALVLHLSDADSISEGLDELYALYAAGVRSTAITWSRINCFGYGPPYEIPGTPDVGPGLTHAGKDLVRACNELGMLVDLAHLNEAGFWDVEKISTRPLVITGGSLQSLTPSTRSTTDKQLDAIARSCGLIAISTESLRPSGKGIVAEAISQILYVIERVGMEYVAIGSDLFHRQANGGIHDARLPELLAGLAHAGLDAPSVERIGWKNWRRVLEETWQ